MTVRYVGPGGDDGNTGLTWVNRKGTLNGVEDTPVAAGDIIWVGPGVYREALTCDISGSAGNVIEYRADITGKNTNGVGGLVRITGLDADTDTTTTRANILLINSRSYRKFSGFLMDNWNGRGIQITSGANITIERWGAIGCIDNAVTSTGQFFIAKAGGSGASVNVVVDGCWMMGSNGSFYGTYGIGSTHEPTIRNCIIAYNFHPVQQRMITQNGIMRPTLYNCFFQSAWGFDGSVAPNTTLSDSIFMDGDLYPGVFEVGAGDFNNHSFSEDTPGASSLTKRWNMQRPLLVSGLQMPYRPFQFLNSNGLHPQTSSGTLTTDLFGFTRPSSPKSPRGPFVWNTPTRIARSRDGLGSIELKDNSYFWFTYPIALNRKFKLSAWTLRGNDYAGTSPQFIIRRAGKSDVTVTVSGAAGVWNKTTHTLTLDTDDKFVQLFLVSNNTAETGHYYTLFSDIQVAE